MFLVTVTRLEGTQVNYDVIPAVAHCAVTTGGVILRRTVEVASVAGFTMNYNLLQALTKDAAAVSLPARSGRVGPRPDSADCASDLDGKVGNAVEWAAVVRGQPSSIHSDGNQRHRR